MVTTMEMWDEFMNRPSVECLDLFGDEYKKSGESSDLYNHNLVLLDIGNWKRAKINCETIIKKSEHTCDADFIKMGMLEWFLHNTSSAIDFWKQALNAEYTDLVGPIDGPLVLWYAGLQLDDDKLIRSSLKKLKRFWKVTEYRKIVKWPGTQAIAGFLLGEVPAEDFLNKWKVSNDIYEHRRLCRANFWVGMTLLGSSEDKAIQHFKAAFSENKIAILQYEYFLAKWEYARLTKQNLWSDKKIEE